MSDIYFDTPSNIVIIGLKDDLIPGEQFVYKYKIDQMQRCVIGGVYVIDDCNCVYVMLEHEFKEIIKNFNYNEVFSDRVVLLRNFRGKIDTFSVEENRTKVFYFSQKVKFEWYD